MSSPWSRTSSPVLWFLAGTAAFALATGPAGASCVVDGSVPHQFLLNIQVERCLTSNEAIEEHFAAVSQAWFSELARQAMERTKGVVLEGTVIDRQGVMWMRPNVAVLEAIEGVGEPGAWFFEGPSACHRWRTGEVVHLYAFTQCCEEGPTLGVACLLEIDTLEPIPRRVRRLLPREK